MEAEWLREERMGQLKRLLECRHLLPKQKETLEKQDRYYALRGFTVMTRKQSVNKASAFGRFVKKPFEDVTREDVERYLTDLAGRTSAETVTSMKRFLKAFYRHLLAPEDKEHPPVVRWIRVPNSMQSYKLPTDLLTQEEVRQLAEHATHPRDRAIVLVLYESGARVSEILSLRLGDIEFDQYGARIMARGKTGMRKIRLISSVPALQLWIDHHPFKHDHNRALFLSFGPSNRWRPLRYAGLYDVLRQAARLSGIAKRVHPHILRHSRLTELARVLSESELKVFAGWSMNSGMARVYVHLSGDDVDRKILEKSGKMLPEAQPDRALSAKPCTRCKKENAVTATFCTACTLPLDAQELARRIELSDMLAEKGSALDKLLGLLEDADVSKLLAEKTRAATDKKPVASE